MKNTIIIILNLPYIADEVFELMHEFSVFLLKDDKSDIGYYRYYNRNGHFYGNREVANHPSMIHHWQIGFAGLIIAQLGGLMNMARNAMLEPVSDISELYEESKIIDLNPGDVETFEPEHIEIAPPPSLPSFQLESQVPVELNLVPIPPLPDVKPFI